MKLRNSLLLLLTATIWGVAFVAQSVGMDYVGPMTYVCARSVIGMIVLLPVIAVLNRVGPPRAAETPEERRKGRKTLVIGGVCCGAVLCIASCTQQLTLLQVLEEVRTRRRSTRREQPQRSVRGPRGRHQDRQRNGRTVAKPPERVFR